MTPDANPHADDLQLARACAGGDSDAMRRFDADILDYAVGAIRSIDSAPSFIDEVQQLVRHRLFIGGDNTRPKIADYAGRGPLRTWVRVVAVRTAIDLRKKYRREEHLASGPMMQLCEQVESVELVYLRAQYAADFTDALRRACNSLDKRARTVLRMRFADDLSIEQIGAIYGVHRATAARWIAKARDDVFRATRNELVARLRTKLGASELDSFVAVMRSRLEFSISSILRTPQG